MAVGRPSGLSVARPPALPVRHRSQGVDSRLGNEDHTSSMAAISAVGAAAGNVFLTAKTHSAAAAIASDNLDLGAIDKHGLCGASGNWRRSTNGTVADIHATPFTVEKHDTIRQCKEGVVRAHAYVIARMELGSHLTNEDVAGLHRFATKPLHAPPLRVGVATVAA